MINTSMSKQIDVILPNTNKALAEVLKNATQKELETLTQKKDLNSIINSFFKQSDKNEADNKMLLSLIKNNPTLKELASVKPTITNLLQTLEKSKIALPFANKLKSFLTNIEDINSKDLQIKLNNSGIFLESKIKNLSTDTKLKELFSNDLKAILLKTHDEISSSQHPNKTELLRQMDKLNLQIDYYQLLSHLSNSSAIYVPYHWDGLEDGNINIKKVNDDKYFCDIELKLKEYGELKLRLGMFEKNQLSINITTKNEDLKNLLKNNLKMLKKQLFSVGITPKEIRFLDESLLDSAYKDSSDDLAMGFEIKA